MEAWTKDMAFRVATGLAVLAVILVVVDGWLFIANGTIRGDVLGRQQYLNQSVQLGRLNQELVNALGTAALRGNQAIRDLLAASGITVVQTPQQSPAPAPAPTPAPAPGATPAPAPGAAPAPAPAPAATPKK